MRKLFTVLIAFALVFAACPADDGKGNDNSGNNDNSNNGNNNGNTQDNSDVIGAWIGNYVLSEIYPGVLTLDIADGTWIMIFRDLLEVSYNGTWTRDANTLKLTKDGYLSSSATASLSGDKLILTQGINHDLLRPTTLTLTRKVVTTLKINNQSFTEITDVIWQDIPFAENQYENSIKSGKSVTKNVQAGSGYIFFKRKSNPIAARTRDAVVVEEGENRVFTFTDNTVVVDVNNPDNSGTLGALQNTVVRWDDAEGGI